MLPNLNEKDSKHASKYTMGFRQDKKKSPLDDDDMERLTKDFAKKATMKG